uniref:Uncharacterized protein n=1 Tax=Syphacia muris TaxID=451379 RepID=A0A0N5AR66_9BILA
MLLSKAKYQCDVQSVYVELQFFDADIANINPGLSDLVKTGYICLGLNDTVQYRSKCCSKRTATNEKKHFIQSRLDECLHQSLSYEMGPTTVFKVYFYGYRESYALQVVEASCRGPPSGKEAVVLHASNTMFSPLFFASTFLRRAENPENISISDDIYIAPVAMISSYAIDGN